MLVKAPVPVPAPVAKLAPVPVQAPVAPRTGRVNPALYVPKKMASAAPVTVAAATPASTAAAFPPHTVVKGETLYSIARLYKVTVADQQAWNAKPDMSVKIGEVLRVSDSRQ